MSGRLEISRRTENGNLVDCLGIPTFVRVIGEGPPVLVFHGGPGFSHDYLEAPLRDLAARRTLIFYDQPGCGRSGDARSALTASFVFRHARAVIEACHHPGEPLGVVAHSWGAIACIAAHEGLPSDWRFSEGLLIAPVAVERSNWDRALARLLERIPPEASAAFMASLDSVSGQADFSSIAPYYGTKLPRDLVTHISVSARAYREAVASLGSFDYRSAAATALQFLHLLLPDRDFTTPELIGEVVQGAAVVHRIEDGHFPFWGSPAEFAKCLDAAFS